MRVLVLAGLFTAVTAPMAMAGENTIDCQAGDIRRAPAEQRLDDVPPAPAPGTPTIARPTVAQAQTVETPRPASERRRNGKPVPDAALIAPRGVL